MSSFPTFDDKLLFLHVATQGVPVYRSLTVPEYQSNLRKAEFVGENTNLRFGGCDTSCISTVRTFVLDAIYC